ncbi:MAG: thiamine-phosphate kinase [bacterium]|nr:thiamine-phosphate kinase [bacterium]
MATLGDKGEFDLIARIKKRVGDVDRPEVVLGIGDDAAILRPRAGEDLVVSTDALVEGVHFRWRNQAPATVGRRALRVNLSDLAAMGARPVGFTLALAAPASLSMSRIDGLLAGLLRDARDYGCPLIGGNVARARETSLVVTVIGAVARGRALRRDAARPGDRLFVTGTLGAGALALARSEKRGATLRRLPEPRLDAGRVLAQMKACCACIDLSDGFEADLAHVLEESGVGAQVDVDRLPTSRGFAAACAREGFDPLQLAVRCGEDYELLFSLRGAQARGNSEARLRARLGVRVTEIGRIVKGAGIVGLPPSSRRGGFRHF